MSRQYRCTYRQTCRHTDCNTLHPREAGGGCRVRLCTLFFYQACSECSSVMLHGIGIGIEWIFMWEIFAIVMLIVYSTGVQYANVVWMCLEGSCYGDLNECHCHKWCRRRRRILFHDLASSRPRIWWSSWCSLLPWDNRFGILVYCWGSGNISGMYAIWLFVCIRPYWMVLVNYVFSHNITAT